MLVELASGVASKKAGGRLGGARGRGEAAHPWPGMGRHDGGRLINQAARIGLEQQGEFFLKADNKYRSCVHFTCLHILIQI